MSHFFPTEVWSHARKPRSVFRYFSYQRIGAFTAIFDFTLIVAASIATGVVYHFLAFDEWGDVDAYVVIGCYSGLTFVLLSKLLGLYQPNALLSAGVQIRGIVAAWGAAVLFMTSLLFLLKSGANYSRGATISFGFLGVAVIVASRYVTAFNLRRALANGTLGGQRVIVIGDPEELAVKSETICCEPMERERSLVLNCRQHRVPLCQTSRMISKSSIPELGRLAPVTQSRCCWRCAGWIRCAPISSANGCGRCRFRCFCCRIGP